MRPGRVEMETFAVDEDSGDGWAFVGERKQVCWAKKSYNIDQGSEVYRATDRAGQLQC